MGWLTKSSSTLETYRLLDRQGLLEVLHGIEEDQHLVSSPGRNIRRAGGKVVALPLLSQFVAHIRKGGVEFGLGGKAGAVEAALPVNRGDLFLEIRVLGAAEELEEGVLELVGVKRLVGPLAKVVRDELVKVLSSNEAVEGPDKVETLLIRDCAECIIGIDTLVADAELCELVILSVLLDSLLCGTCVSKLMTSESCLFRGFLPSAFQPLMAEKSKWASPPWIEARIRRSRYMVHPSFNQLARC